MNHISTYAYARTTPLSTQLQLQRNIGSTQSKLLELQQQISSGNKYSRPGQSPHSARRTVLIQRLLESNATHSKNLGSAQQSLDLTDVNLSHINDLLTDIKGSLLEAGQSTTSAEQRDVIKAELQSALGRLVDIGNTKVAGRYLFGGAATHRAPFGYENGLVAFNGNHNSLNTNTGFESVIQTNANAANVFGFQQPAIAGNVDLNPILTESTKLSELNGGKGVQLGFISISDTVSQVTVDLRSAKTVGDVVGLIEANAPEGRTIDVALVDGHFEISIDSGSPSTLIIGEVNGGRTAHQLGIYTNIGSAAATIVGYDLDPTLTHTTPIANLQFTDLLGAPTTLDQSSGFSIVQGTNTYTVDISTAETFEDILNAINGSGANVTASISADGKGINIQSNIAGVDFAIGENGGTTATQLGIRSFTSDTLLSNLNFGLGVQTADGVDFTITTNSGNEFSVDISSAKTIGDVLDIINAHPDNQDPATRISARLALNGNGIELLDPNVPGATQLTVTRSVLSSAAIDLGLIPKGERQSPVSSDPNVLTGADVNKRESASVFTTLQRLIDSLSGSFDEVGFNRAVTLFDQDIDRLSDSLADVALRGQRVEALRLINEEERVQLQTFLSDEFDTNLVDAISQLTIQETTLQTSLQLMARSFQLNLFNFI